MKTLKITLFLILSAVVGLALFPVYSHAQLLDPVTGVSCDQQTDGVEVDWDDLTGAAKYSLDFTCTLDLGDGNISLVDFSIGTSDRTDGGEIGDSYLDVTFEELDGAAAAATAGVITYLEGYTCYVKVKGLYPGRDKGPQNHPFSDPAVSCGIIPAH